MTNLNKNKSILLLDGYVDEPTCLGVPPFISPYIRNTYGALTDIGFKPDYKTIDQIRYDYSILNEYEIIIILCGCAVPGKYLSGRPIYEKELFDISKNISDKQTALLVGPVQYLSYFTHYPKLIPLKGYPSIAVSNYFGKTYNNEFPDEKWAKSGSNLVTLHPMFPDLIAEITTFSGCLRKEHCSFCIEGSKKEFHRDADDITSEMKELNELGITRFRIGNQSDLLSYRAEKSANLAVRPINNLEINTLFDKIAANIDYEVLHIDNVNPLTITSYPNEAKLALQKIAQVCTDFNCSPLGIESADMAVVQKNNLKCTPDQVFHAVQIVNEAGQGKLLPGLNFVFGLSGETKKTYDENFNFLKKVKDAGLLLRRINLRKVFIHPHTKLGESKIKKVNSFLFKKFKDRVNKEIDLPMMKKVFPLGKVIKNVKVEKTIVPYSIARQIASYPITCEIPLPLKYGDFIDVFPISHHARSLICLPVGAKFNELTEDVLMKIHGISRKSAADIVLNRPNIDYSTLPEYLIDKLNFENC